MDVISYLLGKKSSGGGGSSNNNVFVDTVSDILYDYNAGIKSFITSIDVIDTSKKETLRGFLKNCVNLKTVPLLNTKNCTNFQDFLYGCTYLETIPVFDTSKATNLRNAFQYCKNFNNTSLDNILQMCINANSYNSTKTLSYIGLDKTDYPVSRIEALPHYQDFINAGWTIGY